MRRIIVRLWTTQDRTITTVRDRQQMWVVLDYYSTLFAEDGKGDLCDEDWDGDGVLDRFDVCPDNKKIYKTDFRTYQVRITYWTATSDRIQKSCGCSSYGLSLFHF